MFAVALASVSAAPRSLFAQHTDPTHTPAAESPAVTALSAGASAIVLGTVAAPGIGGRTLAEGYLTQPMAMGSVSLARGRIVGDLTLNFEGITLERGELNAGMYGEGYVDRRHPHTWLHEAVVTGVAGRGASRFSVTVGKGFVPFGTDDPMSRPFVKYPVNHHLAQILERAIVSAAAASGQLILEGAAFNGDEPDSPSDMPNTDRIFDSWAARLSVRTAAGVEAQASMAQVESPEIQFGGGLDQLKMSVSVRYEREGRYLLGELARTRESESGGHETFDFLSLLAEGSITRGRIRTALRAERSERPEEERLLNAFRTPRPHNDLNILGRTRWAVLSLNTTATYQRGRASVIAPFAEISVQHPTATVRPTAFEPEEFYGSSYLWSFSAGIRLGIGLRHVRMGRYGAAADHGSAHVGAAKPPHHGVTN